MKKLRVLLIGAAFSADLHSDGYSRILDKVEIVGICDKALDRIEELEETLLDVRTPLSPDYGKRKYLNYWDRNSRYYTEIVSANWVGKGF